MPARFKNSKAVGAVFGQIPSKASIAPEYPNRQNAKLRRSYEAHVAYRSGPNHGPVEAVFVVDDRNSSIVMTIHSAGTDANISSK